MPKLKLPEWPHIPRPHLAKRYLQPTTEFGIRALTLFAGRGIGKTEFIKKDLIPLARERGFVCIYADVWTKSENPTSAIARALEQWDKQDSAYTTTAQLKDRARSLFMLPVTKAKAEVSLLGHKASLEADFPKTRAAKTVDDSERLINAFEAVVKKAKRKPILFVIDEAQTLAAPQFEPLVKTLRSLFQTYDERVTRMFTGSSRMGLERMFRRSRAPLFGQGGTMDTFPTLDREFIKQIVLWFAQRTGGADLNEAATWRAFERLHHSARLFRAAVESVLIGSVGNITDACELVRLDLLDDEELRTKLSKLSVLQRCILQLVWQQGADLYGANTLTQLGRQVGAKIDVAKMQSALQRLERMELIYRVSHGEYRIELPELELALEEHNSRLAD